MNPFRILGLLGGKFQLHSNFKSTFCKQTAAKASDLCFHIKRTIGLIVLIYALIRVCTVCIFFSTNFFLLHFSMRERSGSVVECLTRDRGAAGSKSHRRHCVVALEQDTFILA